MNAAWCGINDRLDTAEEKFGQLEGIAVETIQNEKTERKHWK